MAAIQIAANVRVRGRVCLRTAATVQAARINVLVPACVFRVGNAHDPTVVIKLAYDVHGINAHDARSGTPGRTSAKVAEHACDVAPPPAASRHAAVIRIDAVISGNLTSSKLKPKPAACMCDKGIWEAKTGTGCQVWGGCIWEGEGVGHGGQPMREKGIESHLTMVSDFRR